MARSHKLLIGSIFFQQFLDRRFPLPQTRLRVLTSTRDLVPKRVHVRTIFRYCFSVNIFHLDEKLNIVLGEIHCHLAMFAKQADLGTPMIVLASFVKIIILTKIRDIFTVLIRIFRANVLIKTSFPRAADTISAKCKFTWPTLEIVGLQTNNRSENGSGGTIVEKPNGEW